MTFPEGIDGKLQMKQLFTYFGVEYWSNVLKIAHVPPYPFS
jgi:hypothetical protein